MIRGLLLLGALLPAALAGAVRWKARKRSHTVPFTSGSNSSAELHGG